MKRLTLVMIVAFFVITGCSSDNEKEEVTEDDIADTEETAEDIKDYYEMVSINITYGDVSEFWASNSNARTLGSAIDEDNRHVDFFELKETDKGRIINSLEGYENDEDNRWIILSESCGENQQCDDDVDSILLDEEKEFMIIYADMEDLDFVED